MVQMFPLGEHCDLQLAADAFCYQRGCCRYSTEYFCGPVQWALLCPGRNKPSLLAVSRAISVECLAYIGSFLEPIITAMVIDRVYPYQIQPFQHHQLLVPSVVLGLS
jgi:hypothetical protein